MNEETKEYRTLEQWEEICESAINGNWKQAGQECEDYGFWANDMINMFEEYPNGIEATDLAILTEIAMKIRCINGYYRDEMEFKEAKKTEGETKNE